jgi:hypothetical protein
MRARLGSTCVQTPMFGAARCPADGVASASLVRADRLADTRAIARSTLAEWIERARQRIELVNERIERNEETLRRVRDFLEGRAVGSRSVERSSLRTARATRALPRRALRARDG